MSTFDAALRALCADTAAFLRSQAEWGLTGLDIKPEMLSKRATRPATKEPLGIASGVFSGPEVGAAASGEAGLRAIRQDLGDCRRCKLCTGRTHIVFGVGSARARLMLIGEAPGRYEDIQGEPFVGEAGKLLDRMLAAMGLKRCEVYIANLIKCRPPNNRDPQPDEVAACEPFLKRQIHAIGPEALVALGRYASQALLKDTTPISTLRGHWHLYESIALMPTFHPAYLLRSPQDKRLVWKDLQEVMKKLGLRGRA